LDVVSTVASVAPQRVVHVGCDPATFARDINYWNEHGFQVQRLSLVNAFPGTHHFEVIALLEPGIAEEMLEVSESEDVEFGSSSRVERIVRKLKYPAGRHSRFAYFAGYGRS